MLPRCGCGCGGQRNAAASANSASSQLILSSSTTNLPTQSSNIMAESAVKIPLAAKKKLKDGEPECKKQCDRATAIIGAPVTFTYSLESAWVAMEGHNDQGNIPSVALQYLKAFVDGLERECKDPLTKEQVNKLWTTKNITFTIEPKTFDGKEYIKTNVGAWEGYNGIRLINGSMDIVIRHDTFWVNVSQVGNCKYAQLFANIKTEGELPLKLRQEIVKEKDNIEKMKARIAKAVGFDSVEWDYTANLSELLPIEIKGWTLDVYQSLKYLNALAECLERNCKDDMVKEAIQEAFAAKKVRVNILEKMEGIKGLETHTGYNGVQFLDGQLIVFTTKDNWATNINQVAQFDLVKLF